MWHKYYIYIYIWITQVWELITKSFTISKRVIKRTKNLSTEQYTKTRLSKNFTTSRGWTLFYLRVSSFCSPSGTRREKKQIWRQVDCPCSSVTQKIHNDKLKTAADMTYSNAILHSIKSSYQITLFTYSNQYITLSRCHNLLSTMCTRSIVCKHVSLNIVEKTAYC